MPNQKLTDNYVLITGASSGIGANLTHQFAKDGYPLILTARNINQLNTLADSLKKKYGVDVQVVPTDLSVPGAAKSIYDFTEVAGFRVGVLVNDAGSGYYGNFSLLPLEKQRETIMVNVLAVTELTRLFLPNMLKDKRGGIMNLASIASYLPGPNLAVYHATKAYILSLSLALAEELAPFGIQVTAICPGATKTSFQSRAHMQRTRAFQQFGPMQASTVAKKAYTAFKRGDRIEIIGAHNKLLVEFERLLPQLAITKIAKVMLKKVPRKTR